MNLRSKLISRILLVLLIASVTTIAFTSCNGKKKDKEKVEKPTAPGD